MGIREVAVTGQIPGLLGRGSPVFFADYETPEVVVWVEPPKPHAREDDRLALIAPAMNPCLGTETRTTELFLDLSDATGRNHAAMCLGSRLIGGPAQAIFYGNHDGQPRRRLYRLKYVSFGWGTATGLGGVGNHVWTERDVPELSDLSQENDDICFEDGYPIRDAEALRLILLHEWKLILD